MSELLTEADCTPNGMLAFFRRTPCEICGQPLCADDTDDYCVDNVQDVMRFPFDPDTGKDSGAWCYRPSGEQRWVHGDGRHGAMAQSQVYDGQSGLRVDRF